MGHTRSMPGCKGKRPGICCATMLFRLNGDDRACRDGTTVADLVQELGLKKKPVAVEINESIVPHDEFVKTILYQGDEVEIVHFVGGGS